MLDVQYINIRPTFDSISSNYSICFLICFLSGINTYKLFILILTVQNNWNISILKNKIINKIIESISDLPQTTDDISSQTTSGVDNEIKRNKFRGL